MVFAFLFALVFLGVGGVMLYAGGKEFRTIYHILTNDPVPIRELHGHQGPVEIEGAARPHDDSGTVTAPFSGTECIGYTYEVEELRSSGRNSSWHTLEEGTRGVDFVVEDETGRVRVEPAGADFRLEDHARRVSPGEALPPRLERFVESTDDVEKQDGTVDLRITELNVGNKQRFTERRLDVEESVYVYGQARPDANPEWGSNLVDAVVSDGEAAPAFVVSDTDERGTALRFGKRGIAYLAFGLVFFVFGALVVVQ